MNKIKEECLELLDEFDAWLEDQDIIIYDTDLFNIVSDLKRLINLLEDK